VTGAVTAVGAVTVPANAIARSAIFTNSFGGRVVTNLSTICTNIFWYDARGMVTNMSLVP
jgi:hypothetical protein